MIEEMSHVENGDEAQDLGTVYRPWHDTPPRAEKGLTPTECLETACKNAEDPEEEQEYEMTQPARHAQMPPRMRAMQMCLVTLGSSRLTTGHSYDPQPSGIFLLHCHHEMRLRPDLIQTGSESAPL